MFDLPHWAPELAADPILDMCGAFEYSITINTFDITAYEPAIVVQMQPSATNLYSADVTV